MLTRTTAMIVVTIIATFSSTFFAADNSDVTAVAPVPESAQVASAAWVPMMVITADAEVFRGDVSIQKLSPGAIVHISKTNDPWLLVPQYDGWVDKKHLLSLKAAEETCTKLLNEKPDATLFHHRAIARSEQGEYDLAIADYDKAIELKLKSAAVYINRGIAWLRKNELEKAQKDFSQAISIDPKDARACYNRSMVFALQGNDEQALKDINSCLKLDPTFAEGYNDRGQLYVQLGNWDAALKDFDEALRIRKKFPAALENRALVRETKGDFAGAVQDYADSMVLFPDSVGALNDLAMLLATCPDQNIRNPQNAVAYAERACQLTDQKDANCLDTLAITQAATGDFKTAIATAQNALKLADTETKTQIEAHLTLFQSNKPVPHPSIIPPPAKDSPQSDGEIE